MDSRRIKIFDTTLRDGEQAPGIALAPRRKGRDRRAARAARRRRDRGGLRGLVARRLRGRPRRRPGGSPRHGRVALPRQARDDIDAAAAALARRAALRIHVFLATSAAPHGEEAPPASPTRSSSRRRRRRRPRVRVADEVEFSCEDATRSDPGLRRRPSAAPPSRPARRPINLPTRSATRCPREYAAFFGYVRDACPALADVTLSAHCHDDLGLAVANSLAGARRRRRAGRVHGQRHRRARGQRRARGGRDGASRPRRRPARRHTGVDIARDRPRLAARRAPDGLPRAAATRRSSARTRSPTRPASTRTGC